MDWTCSDCTIMFLGSMLPDLLFFLQAPKAQLLFSSPRFFCVAVREFLFGILFWGSRSVLGLSQPNVTTQGLQAYVFSAPSQAMPGEPPTPPPPPEK